MRAALALGVRLAFRTSRDARVRAGLVALAAAIGTLVILSVLAINAADQANRLEGYMGTEMNRVAALIIVIVALQVAGLAGVAGRLAAALRSRRLGNLRLLGLSAGRTRMVAATEVAVAAAAGAIAGLVVFPLARLGLSRLRIAGQSWDLTALAPPAVAWALVPLGVVTAVVALAVLPERVGMRSALQQAHRADARPPSWWRLVPLLAGIAVCAYVQSARRGDESAAMITIAGIVLLGVGTILVLPVFVRLVAVALLRGSGGATTMIAARRLQSQPAAVTRVVTGLLLALFLVVGARGVVGAFEATPQYRAAARQVHEQQSFAAELPESAHRGVALSEAVSRIEAFPGVREVVVYNALVMVCGEDEFCGQVIVADCAMLAVIMPDARGCRDGEVRYLSGAFGDGATITIAAPGPDGSIGASLVIPTPQDTTPIHAGTAEVAGLVIPPDLAGIDALTARAAPRVHVAGDPGRDLGARLLGAGLVESTDQGWMMTDYDFVDMLRTIVYAVAAVVAGIGLLAFSIAAIDRVISRRRELVSLRLAGVPAGTLRRAQWIEALVPITFGSLLAIALGQLAGATYLAFGDFSDTPTTVPWRPILILSFSVAAAGIVVAGLTVVATNQPIRPDMIRTE